MRSVVLEGDILIELNSKHTNTQRLEGATREAHQEKPYKYDGSIFEKLKRLKAKKKKKKISLMTYIVVLGLAVTTPLLMGGLNAPPVDMGAAGSLLDSLQHEDKVFAQDQMDKIDQAAKNNAETKSNIEKMLQGE